MCHRIASSTFSTMEARGGCSLELVHCLWVQSGLEPTNTWGEFVDSRSVAKGHCLLKNHPKCVAHLLRDSRLVLFGTRIIFKRMAGCPDRRGIQRQVE